MAKEECATDVAYPECVTSTVRTGCDPDCGRFSGMPGATCFIIDDGGREECQQKLQNLRFCAHLMHI